MVIDLIKNEQKSFFYFRKIHKIPKVPSSVPDAVAVARTEKVESKFVKIEC